MYLPAPVPDLHLNLLGGFEVRRHADPVVGLAYVKMRALLAYLAVQREQDHKREVLAELLWSSSDAATARGNLRRTLSHLRQALEMPSGADMFITSKHTIRFIADAYVDVIDFTQQMPTAPENNAAQHRDERIIDLYRGEFLAGLSLPDCPDFESWLQIQRETLHRRALALLEEATNRHESTGNLSKALGFALRYCELEPWDEEACRRVMRLYAMNGQSMAAISQYEACCRLLKSELKVLPSEETRLLAERIRGGKFRPELPIAVVTPPPQTLTHWAAERRQVTVLYCELTLAATDDPDEALALLHQPQARCAAIIRQFSGHIVQTHGGGLLVYFGYPQAHEDAPRRAVQAALAVVRETAPDLEIRAGVHTGLIITGGDSSIPDTSGRTSLIAIRLCHCTAQFKVAISQETHSIVAGYFDSLSLGAQVIPGFDRPLEIFTVHRENGVRTRLEAAEQLTPLAGRQAEITQIMDLWEMAAQGARQVRLIQGEAGIGKSRLLHAVKERLADKPHVLRELRCFPEFSQSPFHPLIAMLESIFGFECSDTPEARFGRMAAYFERIYPASAAAALPLFGQLLSLPLDAHFAAPAYSPQKLKEQTCAMLLGMLQSLATQQPVLLLLEDLHWIDPSTLELLTLFMEQEESAAILTLLTARPGFVAPWKEAGNTALTLAPLTANDVSKMIASIRSDIPAATVRRIVERADGVPLFAQEMAKIASLDHQARIPGTLHDLLAARMDSLGPAKYTAQLAATLGREFDLNLLGKVFPDGPIALSQALNVLREAGLISMISSMSCQFKHALTQEAAYQSQTKADQQAAHQRIAQVLLDDFPDVLAHQPELLARHLSCGGATQLSIDYWIKAGQRAAMRSANQEAVEHFNCGLQLLPALAPSPERDQQEFALRVSLGATLIATQGYGSLEAGNQYTQAATLSEQLGDRAGLFTAMWGMWLGLSSRIGHVHALGLSEKLLQLAQQDNEPRQLQKAHYAMGNSLLWAGQLNLARRHQEQGVALYQPSHHASMARDLGENICVSTGSQLAWVLWLQGFPDQAQAAGKRTLALASELHHPYSQCYAIANFMALTHWLRQISTTRQLADQTLVLANQHGFPIWLLSGLAFQGWTQAMQGDASGIEQLQLGVNTVRVAMSGIEAFFLAPLCQAYLNLGQWQESLAVANTALATVQAKDDRFLESELLRLKGECLLKIDPNDTAQAQACFSQALAISQRQGAKSLQLRAAMSLARLWQHENRQLAALKMLNEIYSWFTEGFDTADLQDARKLLESLRIQCVSCHSVRRI